MTSSSIFHVHSLPHFLFMDPEMTSFINSILWGRELIVFRLYVLLDNQTTLLNCLDTEKIYKSETNESLLMLCRHKRLAQGPIHKSHRDAATCLFSPSDLNLVRWMTGSERLRLRSERLGLSDWRSRSRGERLLTIWTYTACGNITQQSFVKQFSTFNI